MENSDVSMNLSGGETAVRGTIEASLRDKPDGANTHLRESAPSVETSEVESGRTRHRRNEPGRLPGLRS